jgi:hypothetical protein
MDVDKEVDSISNLDADEENKLDSISDLDGDVDNAMRVVVLAEEQSDQASSFGESSEIEVEFCYDQDLDLGENESDDDNSNEIEEESSEKKVRCTSRCTTGCKRCICARKKKLCGDECGCNEKCINRVERLEDEINQWVETKEFIPQKKIIDDHWKAKPLCSGNTPFEISREMLGPALQVILETTNQWLHSNPQRNLTSITNNLLWRYIAVMITMGLTPHPHIKLYWATDNKFYGSPMIKELLPRDLFLDISRSIRSDKKEKNSTLESRLNESLKKLYSSVQFLVIDETLVPFKGRFKFRQHIPLKPKATGVKLYLFADSAGYVLGFWVYKGKDYSSRDASVYNIVKDFVTSFNANLNHIFIADSYYGS